MTLNDAQHALLNQPLEWSHVKQRKGPGGRKLDYLTGGTVIAAANRIFGFDGWSCETVEMNCVCDSPITYVSKVRVKVGDAVREGWGGADGRDHENTIKSAETDALKRALKSFGNQFGLPLYDKEENADNISTDEQKPSYKRSPPTPQQNKNVAFDAWEKRISQLTKDANFVEVDIKIRNSSEFNAQQSEKLLQALATRKSIVLAPEK